MKTFKQKKLEEFDYEFTDTCGNWIPLLRKKDGAVEKDIMFSPKEIKAFLSQSIDEAVAETKKEMRETIANDDEIFISEEIRQARNRMKSSLIKNLTL